MREFGFWLLDEDHVPYLLPFNDENLRIASEWAYGPEGLAHRRVALDRLGDTEISTVFLIADHSFREDGFPILFETLVMGGPEDGEMTRYATWYEAEEGHRATVARLIALTRQPDGGAQA